MFSHCICYDLFYKCLVPFRHRSWINIISWLSFLGRGSSLKSFLITRLMLVVVVDYIQREKNARLYSEALCSISIVYRDIVHFIVSKVNLLHNMPSLDTNRWLHIS